MRKSIKSLMDQVNNIPEAMEILQYYADRAHYSVVYDLIKGYSKLGLEDLDFYNYNRDSYMVTVYEDFSQIKNVTPPYDLGEVITALGGAETDHDHITMGEHEVIVFKGAPAITQFKDFLERTYFKRTPQKGSPMDSLFICCGPVVHDVNELTTSYNQALYLLNHRFFCTEDTHYIDYEAMIKGEYRFIGSSTGLDRVNSKKIFGDSLPDSVDQLLIYIQTFQRKNIEGFVTNISKELFSSSLESYDMKILLADFLLRAKEKITSRYPELSPILPGNGEIMRSIFDLNFMHQIIAYYNKQFDTMMSFIGSSSSESVLDDIIGFIDHNYADDLTLESISPLFGYNSAYLGKIFTKKTGVTFNSYLDSIRITQAKKLLTTENLKVYEVASRVGYNNVDYFHIKFKKYVGMSPAVYKKNNQV